MFEYYNSPITLKKYPRHDGHNVTSFSTGFVRWSSTATSLTSLPLASRASNLPTSMEPGIGRSRFGARASSRGRFAGTDESPRGPSSENRLEIPGLGFEFELGDAAGTSDSARRRSEADARSSDEASGIESEFLGLPSVAISGPSAPARSGPSMRWPSRPGLSKRCEPCWPRRGSSNSSPS
jgi:hypothetical protein